MKSARRMILSLGAACWMACAPLPAPAASCPAAFPASASVSPPARTDPTPCADALLSILFRRVPPPPGLDIHVVDTRYARDSHGQDNVFVTLQIASAERRRLCPASSSPADLQVNFIRDPRDGWTDLDSRGSFDPAECGQWSFWSEQEIADLLDPPRFAALPVSAREGVRDVAKGDPERTAILDAVREANADLNDRVPIVFVVERLRSDGRTAYFRGMVRRKSDGRPLDAAIWGACEQDPDTAVLEALLEKRNGRWRAIKANRCADDVLFTQEEQARYRLFLMDE